MSYKSTIYSFRGPSAVLSNKTYPPPFARMRELLTTPGEAPRVYTA